MLDEPLVPSQAKQLIQRIIMSGSTVASRHALQEMKTDNLTAVDVINVLRGGVVDPPEYEAGTYRYRVRTRRIVVIVAFRSESEIRLVTAWRVKS